MDNTLEILVSIDYRSRVPAGRHQELDDYILNVTADILGSPSWNDSGTGSNVDLSLGKLKFNVIQIPNTNNDQIDLHDVFDVTRETLDVGNALFGPDFQDFRASVQKQFPDAIVCDNILHLHYLTIERFAQGQDVGLSALRRVISDWGHGCSLVIIKPFPLQFESKGHRAKRSPDVYADFKCSEAEAFRKLRAHYARLGFERIGRSMFYALCPLERQPEPDLPENGALIRLPRAAIEAELTRQLKST
jgi:hypothetical protein